MDILVIGCGLCGGVIARHLTEQGKKVTIWELQDHIGGNMFNYKNEHGFLVQKYGPHMFHTKKKELFDYMCRFEKWNSFKLICGAVWSGKYTPTPFNFTTIDTFFSTEKASVLKEKLSREFTRRLTATVVEVLKNPDPYGFNEPAALIIVTNDRISHFKEVDSACAAENMMLAAKSTLVDTFP